MKAINQETLLAMLSEVKGTTFATLVTRTDARLKKTGNPFGPVEKISRTNVCLGFQYQSSVNRQRTREGNEAEFHSLPRSWGERIPGTMFVHHKGKLYLETKVERSLGYIYRDSSGQELSSESVKPFLPAKRFSSRQETEKEILIRDYALNSICGITFKGEDYVVLPD